MEDKPGFNKLYQWLHNSQGIAIGGSATPGLSLEELISISNDPEATRAAFQFNKLRFVLGATGGSLQLRQTITQLYDQSLSGLKENDIVVSNGTTGSNHIVLQSLLKAGDHVICQYPVYGPEIEEPQHIGCEISYLQLDPNDNWRLNIDQLASLIRPGKTKMLILNNPINPTGTHIDTTLQRDIIRLCKQHDIIIHADEIFRPLFYGDDQPTSFIEHLDLNHDKIVVTSSLSKAYGLSGVRIGWIATKSIDLRQKFLSYWVMTCSSVSTIDEAIAIEALGPRCRAAILDKHFNLARTNLELIQRLIDKHADQCSWVAPTAGSVALVKIVDQRTREAVDDVQFCHDLLETKGVVLSPATLCFEYGGLKEACMGRVRIHFTLKTEILEQGLSLLDEFLAERA